MLFTRRHILFAVTTNQHEENAMAAAVAGISL